MGLYPFFKSCKLKIKPKEEDQHNTFRTLNLPLYSYEGNDNLEVDQVCRRDTVNLLPWSAKMSGRPRTKLYVLLRPKVGDGRSPPVGTRHWYKQRVFYIDPPSIIHHLTPNVIPLKRFRRSQIMSNS